MGMDTPTGDSKFKKTLHYGWRFAKPWLTAVVILLILRYTGALSGITSVTQQAVLQSGFLDADPNGHSGGKESFDYNFSIKTLDGKKVDFNEFKGKPLFLNLWATWCGPCRAEMPSIQKLYNKIDKDSVSFVILSIDAEDDLQKVDKYVASKEFSFPVFIAEDLPPQLQVKVIPTTFVIDKNGDVAYKKSGMADYDTKQFRKFLDKLTY
jgi:thiol-disulfide isomerase/thioredoxin